MFGWYNQQSILIHVKKQLKIRAQVYFRGPRENIKALWQYFKLILFQITYNT